MLLVESQVVEVGNSSFVTRQEIKDKHGRIACVVETVSVAVDMDTQMPRPLTEEEREVMRLESTLAKAADKAEAESGSAPSAGGVQADSLGDEISYDDISYGDEVDYGDEVGYGDEVDYGDEIGYDD